MNITYPNKTHECTSCQMCAAVCPVTAISIKLDEDGFYRPEVSDQCVDCGLCVKVCYKYDTDVRMTSSLQGKDLYAAQANHIDLVKDSTSGGLASLLASYLIGKGYKCIGVAYDCQNAIAYDKVATKQDEICAFRGSKYIQSYTLPAFRELVSSCGNEKYAVFGTPCHIYALHRYLSIRKIRDQFVLIDLYCHGCPTLHLWQKYEKEVRKGKSVDRVNFRDKIKGWGAFNVVMYADDKMAFRSTPQHNEFYTLFFSNQLLNEACYDCKLRGTLEYTDIRLGDFWGPLYVLNQKGVSAVSLVSDRGRDLFQGIKNQILCTKQTYNNFLPYQSWNQRYILDEEMRKKLLDKIKHPSSSIKDVEKIFYRESPICRRLSLCLKKQVNRLHPLIRDRIKKIYMAVEKK